MNIRKKIAIGFAVCVAFIVVCNVHLIGLIHNEGQFKDGPRISMAYVVNQNNSSTISPSGLPFDLNKFAVIEKIEAFRVNRNASYFHRLWIKARKWVTHQQVYPIKQQIRNLELEEILSAMMLAPITKVSAGQGGTQLKIMLTLLGNQKAVFKPMRYSREKTFNDTPYAGADRHNGEIAAFHLSRILNMRKSPLVVGRKLNLREEVIPVADSNLLKTFFLNGNNTCFFGICYYCHAGDPVCAEGDVLEGAVILWLPEKYKLKGYKHPWRRTYKKGVKATWEVNGNFCEVVKKSKLYTFNSSRLLDLVDTAIFDFLIGNADRHRYEVLDGLAESSVLLFDNGKSFGNPYTDEVGILAPLYQCCVMRKSSWTQLHLLTNSVLSFVLNESLTSDPLAPILTKLHLQAMDRRLEKVLEFGRLCISRHGEHKVLQ